LRKTDGRLCRTIPFLGCFVNHRCRGTWLMFLTPLLLQRHALQNVWPQVRGSVWMNPAKGSLLPSMTSYRHACSDGRDGSGLVPVMVTTCQSHYLSRSSSVRIIIWPTGRTTARLANTRCRVRLSMTRCPAVRSPSWHLLRCRRPRLCGERLAITLDGSRFGLDVNNRAGQPTAPVEFSGMLLGVAERFGCAYRFVK